MFDRVCELVGFDDPERGRDTDGEVGLEPVSFPANLDATDGSDPGDLSCFAFNVIDERRIDAAHAAGARRSRLCAARRG